MRRSLSAVVLLLVAMVASADPTEVKIYKAGGSTFTGGTITDQMQITPADNGTPLYLTSQAADTADGLTVIGGAARAAYFGRATAGSSHLVGLYQPSGDTGDFLYAVNNVTNVFRVGYQGYTYGPGAAALSGQYTVKAYEAVPTGTMTATLSSGGALTAGDYTWKVTFVTAGGQTTGAAVTATKTATLNQKCVLTVVPVGSANVTARNIYRTLAGGSTYYYVGQIADNTTVTYTDTSSDATIGAAAAMPAASTALDNVIVAGGSTYGSGTEFRTRVLLPAGTAAQPAIGWAADDDGAGTGIYRGAADKFYFTNNGTNTLQIASIGISALVELSGNAGGALLYAFKNNVANRTTDAAESGAAYLSVITNAGATALVTRTLPTAAAGGNYCFYVADTDGLKVVAASGDEIRIAGTATATAGYIRNSTIGSSVCLVAMDATTWAAINAPNGTWTFDTP